KNRVLAAQLSRWHFAPTESARRNLLREGIDEAAIHVTGNTVIDALNWIGQQAGPRPFAAPTRRFLLVTVHRRENFGLPLRGICAALRDIVSKHEDLSIVLPVHPNPEVRAVVGDELGGRERIAVIAPQPYPEFIALMRGARLILTDSGGVQ